MTDNAADIKIVRHKAASIVITPQSLKVRKDALFVRVQALKGFSFKITFLQSCLLIVTIFGKGWREKFKYRFNSDFFANV